MNLELRRIIAGAACVFLLASCGGGSSDGGNSSGNDDEETPRTFLQIDAATLPDSALRTCVNRLAEENEWQSLDDVDAIFCGDVEIRSIEGLQAFSGLRELRIAAPRLPVSEIPLLASLPLDDYKHKPFYLLNDESSAGNVEPGMKQLLMHGEVSVVSDQVITYVVLLADDPRNPDRLDWDMGYGAGATPSVVGSERVGPYVTLHWVQAGGGEHEGFGAHPYYSGAGLQWVEGPFLNPNRLAFDQPIAQVEIYNAAFKSCILDNAAQHGWTTTWQVTSLDCANRDIELDGGDFGLQYFPELEHLDLRGNPGIFDAGQFASQTDASVLVSDTDLEPPKVEVRECGLFIANFDEQAEYGYWKVEAENGWIGGVPYGGMREIQLWDAVGLPQPQFESWQPGQSAQCMSIAGRGAGVWVVEAEKNGYRLGSEIHPVTNDQDQWVQYLVDDRAVDPLMFLPGSSQSSVYLLNADLDHYEVQQLNPVTWQQGSRHRVDRLPYVATNDGVYLFPARRADAHARRDGALLRDSGVLQELPARPVAGRPRHVMEAAGEIWLTRLYDEWGSRPELLVWNPQTKQWRVAPDIGTSSYSAYVSGDSLCVNRHAWEEDDLCWDAVVQQWRNVTGEPSASKYHVVGDNRFVLGDEDGPYPALLTLLSFGYPISIASGTDGWPSRLGLGFELFDLFSPYVTVPLITLTGYRIGTDEPSFSQPLLAGIPKWMYLTEQRGHVQAIFNDSLARYPLPQVGASNQP